MPKNLNFPYLFGFFRIYRYYDKNKARLADGIACTDFKALLNLDQRLKAYPVRNKRPGICLIFNHERFDPLHLSSREGTRRDVEALKHTFRRSLGFKTVVGNDLCKDDIMSIIARVGRSITHELDCLVCCILTHGSHGDLLWARDAAYHLDDLVRQFTAKNCPALAGKPKVFILQVEAEGGQVLILFSK